MKKILLLALLISSFACYSQTKDSLVYTSVTVSVEHDTIVKTRHDSTYVKVDTIKVPISQPVQVVRGMYISPVQMTIGNATSEDTWIRYGKNKSANVFNLYARNLLTTTSGQDRLAAFANKLRSQGFNYCTVDIRRDVEVPNWQTFYTRYPSLKSFVYPLTEKEPWVFDSTVVNGKYLGFDYNGTFNLLRSIRPVAEKVFFYEGWMGKGYSNPQAAVDSMVKYSDVIYLSNYISLFDYQRTDRGYGPWDNRIKNRIDQGGTTYGGIVKACQKLNKVVGIVEIISLEPEFLFNLFACPASSTRFCRSYYGSTYDTAVSLYNESNAAVLQYTDLLGRTMFYSKYLLQAQQ